MRASTSASLDGHAGLLAPSSTSWNWIRPSRARRVALDVLRLLLALLAGLLLLLAELGLGHLAEAVSGDADTADRGRVLVADTKARAAGGQDDEAQDEADGAR